MTPEQVRNGMAVTYGSHGLPGRIVGAVYAQAFPVMRKANITHVVVISDYARRPVSHLEYEVIPLADVRRARK